MKAVCSFYGLFVGGYGYGVCLDFGWLVVCGFWCFFRVMFYLTVRGRSLRVSLFGFDNVFGLLRFGSSEGFGLTFC